jgi:hypothetical protein
MLTEVVDEHCLKMTRGVIKGGIARNCAVLPHCRRFGGGNSLTIQAVLIDS